MEAWRIDLNEWRTPHQSNYGRLMIEKPSARSPTKPVVAHSQSGLTPKGTEKRNAYTSSEIDKVSPTPLPAEKFGRAIRWVLQSNTMNICQRCQLETSGFLGANTSFESAT